MRTWRRERGRAKPQSRTARSVNGRLPEEARNDAAARQEPSLIRRCAIGIWLCGIALLGVVEFRRHALAGDALAMTPVAWMWLAGSIITGAVGVAWLVRELQRSRR